jgi:purine nucleosidase
MESLTKTKMIIDTDIGDDIDDIIALYMALSMKEVEIVGVISAFRNTALRARQIKKVLTLKGRTDIPVYAGCGVPLQGLEGNKTDVLFCQYTDDLKDLAYAPLNPEDGCQGNKAIDFLVASARKYGSALTIVALSPQTNLALAIRKDPEAMAKVRIVMMGGSYFKTAREWNIECDILAAKTVFESLSPKVCVGLDVTTKVQIRKELQDEILAEKKDDPYKGYLIQCIQMWAANTHRLVTLHDPLTLYAAVHPEICRFVERHVYLETEGKYGRSLTLPLEDVVFAHSPDFEADQAHPCQVATSVKAKEFIRIFRKMTNL